MHYFAYGSNMSSLRLLARVRSARFETTATLVEHDLRFHKSSIDGSAKCDAYKTEDKTHFVMGIVYSLDGNEKPVLDEIEGVGVGYEQKTVRLITAANQIIEAFTYRATQIDAALKPYHWYKHHVLVGAREHGLPQAYTERILEIASIPDPDPIRHEDEMRIYD